MYKWNKNYEIFCFSIFQKTSNSFQMMTSYIYGQSCFPFAMANSQGEVVVVKKTKGPKNLEDFARKICVEFGCSAGVALNPIPANQLKDFCIFGSISRCLSLGQAVVESRVAKLDPIQKIFSIEKGRILCVGKVLIRNFF